MHFDLKDTAFMVDTDILIPSNIIFCEMKMGMSNTPFVRNPSIHYKNMKVGHTRLLISVCYSAFQCVTRCMNMYY